MGYCKLKSSGFVLQVIAIALLLSTPIFVSAADIIDVGERPAHLIADLPAGELKSTLGACAANTATRTDFSISHRGAPFKYPEHTREGYLAAVSSGAGIVECDVTFTNDGELVCRHSQCDLHSSTNILQTPLAQKCSMPPDMSSATPFSDVKCCTSDITALEFKSLEGRFDKANKDAKTLDDYLSLEGTPYEQATVTSGELMTHAESIQLFKSLGVKMIPELKAPQVPMPFKLTNGAELSQKQYAQALVDEYVKHAVEPENVFLQSFSLKDVKYWINQTPDFGKQAAWLDSRFRDSSFDVSKEKSWKPSMQELSDAGVAILAPPLWMMLTLDSDGKIGPSDYAVAAKEAGLELVGWTLERSGSLASGGGWYYQTIKPAITSDSALFQVLDVLAKDVGVLGVFSDWPATTTYYANCLNL